MNTQKFLAMLQRQIDFQKTMNSTVDVMYFAIISELGEFVDSLGFADWKKTTYDGANRLIELVDIAIFSMSLSWYEKLPAVIFDPAKNEDPKMLKPFSDLRFTYSVLDTISSDLGLTEAIIAALRSRNFNRLIYRIVQYEPRVFDIIVAKQALNQLRQDFGYKDGNYVKHWPRPSGKYKKMFSDIAIFDTEVDHVEDNVWLQAFYGLDYQEVYDAMEQIYTEVVIGESLIDVF